MSLDTLGKAMHTVMQEQQQLDAKGSAVHHALVHELPVFAAAFDQACSAHAAQRQKLQQKVCSLAPCRLAQAQCCRT